MELHAYFDTRERRWRFLVLADGVPDTWTAHEVPGFDLNHTAQHDDVWRAMSTFVSYPGDFECVCRARGAFVWREVIAPLADELPPDEME